MLRNNRSTKKLKALINNLFYTTDAVQLLQLGANPDTKNSKGESLLHLLVRYNRDGHNSYAISELIKKYQADVNIKNAAHKTALQCLLDDKEFFTTYALELVRLGSDPNTKNSNGESLLHLLVSHNDDGHNNYAISELIQKHKADINIKNAAHKTALQCLLDGERFSLIHAMQLVRLGADPNTKNFKGESLLHLLVNDNDDGHNSPAIEELIQKYHADIHIKNGVDKTPLQCLLDNKRFLTIYAIQLVRLGADRHTKNSQGESPLNLLVSDDYDDHNNSAIAALMKKHNPDIDIKHSNNMLLHGSKTGKYKYNEISQWNSGKGQKKYQEVTKLSPEKEKEFEAIYDKMYQL